MVGEIIHFFVDPLIDDCSHDDSEICLENVDSVAIRGSSSLSLTAVRSRLMRRPVEGPPVDAAIDERCATIATPLVFSKPVVSRVIDGVQRYIANADDRPADEVERADAALAALAAQHLSAGSAAEVYINTTNIAAGEGAETVLTSEGYGDSVTFVTRFRFTEYLVSSRGEE
ncbi:hypothetical protein C465_02106 [Halorubrum distributum JCM 9100]|uniref:Uncharacterized protein n=2 Tax=Halorubrum distributum TaxID=29283 RepID=M0F0P5_9EURY|nr:hypothetical protein [Halorubrum distributum]ELZ52209.1 hypothetical protein C465_02106 [Halorubrum distributum JCM 9100]ELZ58993.1 hypothetical protein C466_00300 [Halorubrum distributum JCM 10118]